MPFEFTILDFIQEHFRTAFGDAVMPVISNMCAHGEVWIALAVILLFFKKTRKCGIVIGIALILEALCANVVLKPLVHRTRPYDVNTSIKLIVKPLTDYSFPSGHSGASFAAVSALFSQKTKLRVPALILALLICFSRLYLYVHYPTDILGGIIIGVLCGVAAWKIVKTADEKNLIARFRKNSAK